VAGRFPAGDRRLGLGGSATGLRLLACAAALREGRTTLDGDASLRRRPAGPLAAPLRALGVRVRARRGRPPVVVEGGPAPAPAAPVPVDASATSQVASGLLLVAPLLPGGLRIRLGGAPVSEPYLDLTLAALRRAGVRVARRRREFAVPHRVPRAARIAVEGDWSSAAYPLVAAAILGRRVRVPGLDPRSRQADRAVLDLLRRAGVPRGADGDGAWCDGTGRVRPFAVDLRSAPDLAPAAAALALFAPGESRVTGAAHLRTKESDRIAGCVAAVRALGGRARPTGDGFVVRGGTPRAGRVDPRGDHRLALAFGVAAAAIPGARLLDRGCVAKSWPSAWRDLAPLLRRARRAVSLPRVPRRG
jgi:3-phosphoshikimate 1-carboxyvinyltransferase